MTKHFIDHLRRELDDLRQAGLYKTERVITSKQAGTVALQSGKEVVNLCANNYLGLSDHPDLIEAGREALARYGYGMSSVRFICGTQEEHKELEARISRFLGFEDTILYSSCFDANTGLFETLLGPEDAIISDALNHASIIDGVRLCKAKRFRYANSDMADLEAQLQAAADCRFKLIATDGVFSMDGYIARLSEICDLAERYGAMVMVDESHAVGFVGKTGRGSIEHCNVMGRVDIVTGTLGKALGGASGGYTSGRKEVIDWLRQRSRPYLFSNTLAPVIAQTSIRVLDMLEASTERRDRLMQNAAHFRARMSAAGFDLLPGEHPIIPVMLRDPKLAQDMARRLDEKGVYVAPFSFPVVPRGQDRIRTQMSAAHSLAELDRAIDAFIEVGREMEIIQ
ncbi:glycine C-acetyltransferase [Paracoccus seriniphilus]|uniref:2-amino-3-ketobutyrate coenzyme A ligase n=1 Tax=Paracoccus seriniphilus TaxID=184748 RepID=A0A239Q053_9RHOB|nr:glycine C-acetyltransferase [Paracoccus seriniphilus]WCR15723.1 glycine C-acetyltransferase [Paracoccus seriniphilus]SNT75596.1 2-amino-3-ketobutyrate coenzyme A ligase [Paracoccus seriniphilus]